MGLPSAGAGNAPAPLPQGALSPGTPRTGHQPERDGFPAQGPGQLRRGAGLSPGGAGDAPDPLPQGAVSAGPPRTGPKPGQPGRPAPGPGQFRRGAGGL